MNDMVPDITQNFPFYICEIDKQIIFNVILNMLDINNLRLTNKYIYELVEDPHVWSKLDKDSKCLLTEFVLVPNVAKRIFFPRFTNRFKLILIEKAVNIGDVSKLRLMLEAFPYVYDYKYIEYLRMADKRINMVGILLDNYWPYVVLYYNAWSGKYNNIVLRMAIKHNKLDVAKTILTQDDKIDLDSAIYVAIKYNNLQAVKLILGDRYPCIDDITDKYTNLVVKRMFQVKNINIMNALKTAAEYQRYDIMRVLLEHDPIISDIIQACKIAIEKSNLSIIKLLLTYATNYTSDMEFILETANKYKHRNVRMHFFYQNSSWEKIIDWVVELGNKEILRFVLDQFDTSKLNYDEPLVLALRKASKTKDLSIVYILMQYGATLESRFSIHRKEITHFVKQLNL